MHNPEFRLKSRSGQDRSANQRCARTTDKGYENRRIYSLVSRNNKMKRELTQTWAGITIHAAYGPITVIPDRNCPSQIAYLLSMDTFKFRSLGKAPHILTYGLEGLEGIRVGNADALEIRIGYYGNLICNAPGWNCVVSLSQ
jgi:hypothetical protein